MNGSPGRATSNTCLIFEQQNSFCRDLYRLLKTEYCLLILILLLIRRHAVRPILEPTAQPLQA
jgi:hypothetical protein